MISLKQHVWRSLESCIFQSCLLPFQPCMVLSETEMVCVTPDLGQGPVKSTPGCDGGDLKYNLDLEEKDGVV